MEDKYRPQNSPMSEEQKKQEYMEYMKQQRAQEEKRSIESAMVEPAIQEPRMSMVINRLISTTQENRELVYKLKQKINQLEPMKEGPNDTEKTQEPISITDMLFKGVDELKESNQEFRKIINHLDTII